MDMEKKLDLPQVRADHLEERDAKARTVSWTFEQLQERLFQHLVAKNNFAANRLPHEMLAVQLQSLSTSCELAAMADILERMGKINRVDFATQCTKRLEMLIQRLEHPGAIN